MSFLNSIAIVASPRPRVGKTLLARLLTDFHLQEGRSVAAFDLNSGEGTLAQFLPEHVTRSAIDDIKGQMALFDRLTAVDGVTKIVDLGHTSFDCFFALANQFDFTSEARTRGITPVVLYPLTPDSNSVEAYRKLRGQLSEATLAPVQNELLGSREYQDKYGLTGRAATVIRLPVLEPRLRRYVETPPFSFADSRLPFALNMSNDLNTELQRWLRRIYLEFRELGLRMLLTDLNSSILR